MSVEIYCNDYTPHYYQKRFLITLSPLQASISKQWVFANFNIYITQQGFNMKLGKQFTNFLIWE